MTWQIDRATYHNLSIKRMEKIVPEYYRNVFQGSIETQKQFTKDLKKFHKHQVLKAVTEGKPVPRKVLLADYPELLSLA